MTDPRSNTVFTHTYMMQGQVIKRIHQDSGTRKVFINVMNNPVKQWDDRGHLVTTAYDALYRVTGRRVDDGTTDRLVESYIYGEGQTDPETHNLRGKLYRVKDGAGQVTFAEYDFKGNPISKLQETLEDYETAVNWDNSQTFDTTTYTTTSKYDALNRPVETITPDSSKYVPTFNQGGDLDTVGVYLRGDTQNTSFISEITYNNRRQRSTITYGSGVETAYTYDSKTFRLIRLLTERGSDVLQDFLYTFDPEGNITTMKDEATQILYYGNNIIDADRDYTYDALYRLTNSEGREHINQPGNETDDFPSGIVLPHPNDPQAMRRYSRSYAYDNSGNISEMAHTATGANWTRDYTYNSANNKLTQTQIGSTPVSYSYDNHGNLQSLPNVTAFTWDFADQVKETDLGGGGTAYYVYNAEGQRVRKVIHNNSDVKIKETIYLDGYEIYHDFVTGSVDFERETLHVMDDESRVAMVETKTIENGSPISTPVPRIRYQHSDHLGSCSVETSDTGALISFEEYYPYGGTSFQSTSSTSEVSAKRYRYNGKEKDEETSLYYYGARYYISWLGRWMNCDPIGEEGSGLNLYRYVSNNPVVRVDPDGMDDYKVGDVVEKKKLEESGEYNFVDDGKSAVKKETQIDFDDVEINGSAEQQKQPGKKPVETEKKELPAGSLLLQSFDYLRVGEARWSYHLNVKSIPETTISSIKSGKFSIFQGAENAVKTRRLFEKVTREKIPSYVSQKNAARNLNRYGDPLGPKDLESARIRSGNKPNKTNLEVIKSSGKTSGFHNKLAGVMGFLGTVYMLLEAFKISEGFKNGFFNLGSIKIFTDTSKLPDGTRVQDVSGKQGVIHNGKVIYEY